MGYKGYQASISSLDFSFGQENSSESVRQSAQV